MTVTTSAVSGGTTIGALLKEKTGSSDPFVSVRRMIDRILFASGQVQPPIRIRPLLRLVDAEFDYTDEKIGDAQAAVQFRDGRLLLQIPREQIKQEGRTRRWRFSVAHEFVHIILMRSLGASVVDLAQRDEATYNFVEQLCDFGASHLLVPRHHLTNGLRRDGITIDTVSHMSESFDVSWSVVLRSLNDLLPGGGIFLMSRFSGGASGKNQLRIRQCSTSNKEMPERPWIPFGCGPKHLGVSHDDLTSALNAERNIELTIRTGGNTWHLDAMVGLWPFMPYQRLDFDLSPREKRLAADQNGVVVICARQGRLDKNLFQSKARQ